MGERKLCYGCMERVEFVGDMCPNCGYSEQMPVDPSFITPGTVLHDRYIIGVATTVNGEGITYLAYDQSIGCKVYVREYMPPNLCSRVADSPVIRVIPARLAQYKALMAEFTELHKSLARLRGQVHICTVVDLFAENNTTYVVDEYVESIKFIDYLKDHAGELTWSQMSQILPPLTTTLSILHNAGVVHRAISPDTIYVTDKGELLLTSFSIAAARTANTELECEIYNGYAAPEQYAADEQQGTWTDVYAVCAVLYRVLTGSMPPSAISRLENDNLVAPAIMNSNVPRHVSDVIMQGMQLQSANRIQTITELVTDLFDENAMNGAMPYDGYDFSQSSGEGSNIPEEGYDSEYADDYAYDEDYDNYTEEDEEDEDEEKPGIIDRLKIPIIIGIVLLIILLIVVFVFASDLLGSDDEDSSSVETTTTVTETEETTEETTESTGDSIMPSLVGKNYENQKEQYSSWITFDVEEVYSDDYNEGIICWQEYEAGETFDSSEPVKIQVSKGAATVTIPSYSGYGVSSYCSLLEDMGITCTQVSKSTSSYSDGTVMYITRVEDGTETELAAGTTIDLNDGDEITVYYAYNPVVETTVATTQATTEATTAATTEAATEAPAEDSADAEEEAAEGEDEE